MQKRSPQPQDEMVFRPIWKEFQFHLVLMYLKLEPILGAFGDCQVLVLLLEHC